LVKALRARGMSARDAAVLARIAEDLPKPRGVDAPLFPFLHARLTKREWALVIGAVAETQARGPRGRLASGWRLLYVAGCPIDQIWRVLWHSFKDPSADPQDDAWLAETAGLRNARRYVSLGFPTSGAPDVYGPGLGCETLLENTRSGARELLRLRAPRPLLLASVATSRGVLTPAARDVLDRAAGVLPKYRIGRPSREEYDAVRARLLAGEQPSLEDLSLASRYLNAPAGSDETLDVPDSRIARIARQWFLTLDAMLASGEIVADLGQDRYRLATERAVTRRVAKRRPPAGPPRAIRPALVALLGRWRRKRDGSAVSASARDLDYEDSLQRWLPRLAETPP
jgi:hypothetical protein